MKEIYDEKLTALQKCLDSAGAAEPSPGPEEKIRAIVTGSQPEKAFLRNILDHAIIEKDGTLHLRLRHLPQTWHFAIRYHKTDRGYHRGFLVDSQGVV